MSDVLRAAGDALADAATEVVGWSGLPSELWALLADARDAYRAARDAAPADEIDRLRARVAELETADAEWDRLLTAAHARVDEVQARADEWHRVAVERGHRVAELEAASPDDAHTSTARHTEWLAVWSDEDGDEGAETFETEDAAKRAADLWQRHGVTNVYVERHDVTTTRTVSTTTRTADWKADER